MLEAHKTHQVVLGRAATGCHALGQLILMFDGSLRRVEEISVGEYLMGPDSLPRLVLSLARGRGRMVRIVPTKGESWIVNDDHILTLVRTNKCKEKNRFNGSVSDISVGDWEKLSKTQKHIRKLFRVPVEFSQHEELTLEPYFLGLLLGDGSMRSTSITCNDPELHEEVRAQAKSFGLFTRSDVSGGGADMTYITSRKLNGVNAVGIHLKSLGLSRCVSGSKFIPSIYKTASRQSRLELIAGLMDTDGSAAGGCYDYISKSEQLSNDVAYVARSLGFAAYVSPCQKKCQNGNGGTYYRVCISGNLDEIPSRLERKTHTPRRQKKNHLRTGFKIERLGEGDYYGFSLSGDGRFLLGDFTVTHNTGKAVELAAIAQHYSATGRVLILVDVTKLVRQLADTVKWFTGTSPGIEMADERANNGAFLHEPDRIIVATVQTMYSGPEGRERYRNFPAGEFSAVLLDECELFLAPAARGVVEYFRTENPAIRIYGCTATPMRTDGVAMANLFNHVAFDRDILWGIDQGWLVPARQAFVRVSLDFSTLKVRKSDDGEKDYSETEIAQRINNEQTLIELAKGITHVAGERRSIVVCPDVATAKAVAHYLDAERTGCARCIYGELEDTEKDTIFDAHQQGEFQFLSSVMMLTKGYDDPKIGAVFNCRKTKSKRLYSQILGRGTRPLRGLLNDLDDDGLIVRTTDRKAAISYSEKPDMLMVNMVGVEDSVRDITLIDILGTPSSEFVRERAVKKMLKAEGEVDPQEVLRATESEEKRSQERKREARERRERAKLQIEAKVDVEYTNDLRASGGTGSSFQLSNIPPRTLQTLQRAKVPDKLINQMTVEQAKGLAGQIIYRYKSGLCTYKQAELLKRAGYSKTELHTMTRDAASASIEAVKANGWRRPSEPLLQLVGATEGEL